MNSKRPEEQSDEYDRFIRWQTKTNEQLSAASNTILGLATGLSGFVGWLLFDKERDAFLAGFAVASLVLLSLSIALGVWCAINRLSDFRLTMKVANPKYQNDPRLVEWREMNVCLGRRTWLLFRLQSLSFLIGSVTVGVGLIADVLSR